MLDRMLVKDRDLRIPTPGRLVDELATFCVGADLAGLLGLAQKGLPTSLDLRKTGRGREFSHLLRERGRG